MKLAGSLVLSAIFTLAGAAQPPKQDAARPATIEPVIEVSGAWFPDAVRFSRQPIEPRAGNALLVVALWVKNGEGSRLALVETKSAEDRALAGLSVHWDNKVKVSSSQARLTAGKAGPLAPIGVVVGGSMAWFHPERTGLAREADLGAIPAALGSKPASLMLVFDVPKGASGWKLQFGAAAPLAVDPLATRP